MIPYILVLSLVVFWIVLEKKSLNRTSFWLPLIALTLFAGARSYRVGTDTGIYTKKFNNQLNVEYFRFNENVEFGYQALEYAILNMTSDYFWLLIITSLIVIYCYLKVIKRYSIDYWFSVFLFITSGTYTFFFNGLRQGLAMAVFSLALPYLLEKRFIPYLIVCVIASLFHVTALFMIPFYFIVNVKVKPLNKMLLVFIGSLFTSRFLISYISNTNERYEGYAVAAEKSGGLLTLGFYTVLLVFIYFIIRVYSIKDQDFIKLFTFYATGVVFLIPVAMLGANPSGPQRLLTYFTWTLVLILPIILKKINNFYVTSMAIILFVIYFSLTTTRFSNLTPYMINPIFEIF